MSPTQVLHKRDLTQRLSEAEATIEALLAGQIDAVVDSKSKTPVLLSKAQEALRESETRYRRIVETANEGIWTIDTESKITFANRPLAEMFGYLPREMLGKPLVQFVAETAEGSEALRGNRSPHGISDESEVRFVRRDGSELWALLKTSPIRDANGNHVGTLAMMTDRTHYRQAEEALRKSEEQYRQIVEATSDGILKIDGAQSIVFVNQRFAEMLGFESRDMIGRSVFAFMSAAAKVTAADSFQRREGEKDAFDATFRHKDGTDISVNIADSPLLDEKGQHVGNLAVVRDVTERRKLQSQLMVSDRMASMGTLAAGVAHEINNPLACVIANLEYIAENLSGMAGGNAASMSLAGGDTLFVEEIKAPLDDARAAAQRVRFIVRDLRIFSRSPVGEPRGPVDVEATMESSLRMAWNEIRHRARLVKRYGVVPRVEANEARLGQVFLNLLVNAAQAMPEGLAERNEICVSTSFDGERVVVEVSDTGAGISPENIGRIFDAFFTTKEVGVGTGLGLAICQRIIADMDGELTVESEKGKGTTFRVAIPVAGTEETVAAAPVREIPVAGRRGRILVVDDEVFVVRSVRRVLSKNHDVMTVLAAGDALALCVGGERFDLIICDLMMPNMSGMELHSELLRLVPEQANRMIFLTGGAFTSKARHFLSETPKEHIEKPFDSGNLRAIVQRYCSREYGDG